MSSLNWPEDKVPLPIVAGLVDAAAAFCVKDNRSVVSVRIYTGFAGSYIGKIQVGGSPDEIRVEFTRELILHTYLNPIRPTTDQSTTGVIVRLTFDESCGPVNFPQPQEIAIRPIYKASYRA